MAVGEEPTIDKGAPAPAVTDAPAPAPVVESAPAAAAPVEPQHPSEIPTLLETLKAPGAEPAKAEPVVEAKPDDKTAAPAEKPADAKPPEKDAKADEKSAEDAKPADEKPVEAETPVEYKFEFPENIKPQDEKVAAFTEFAREHKLTPEAAQKAVGYFNEAATAFVQEQARKQVEVWNNMRFDWRKAVLADPMIGGAGHLTAMGVVARVRDMSISDHQPGTPAYEKDAKEYEEFLRITGAGDHPAYHKQLYRLGHRLDEPKMITAPPSPPKNNGVRPSNSLYAPKRQ